MRFNEGQNIPKAKQITVARTPRSEKMASLVQFADMDAICIAKDEGEEKKRCGDTVWTSDEIDKLMD